MFVSETIFNFTVYKVWSRFCKLSCYGYKIGNVKFCVSRGVTPYDII